MPRKTASLPPISRRALNRATLERQGLLQRQPRSATDMLRHLIGLQGQVQNAPHIGLWSRLVGFRTDDLDALLRERRAVRATLMRVTLHVVLAEDFLAIRPLIDPIALRGFRTNHLAPLGTADVDEIRARSRQLLDAGSLTPADLGKKLGERWPDIGAIELSMPARFIEPVVHVPPAGCWGATGAPKLTSAEHWLGRGPAVPVGIDALALRYLAAFGPATGKDFGAWSGLSGGPAAFERLRGQLVTFQGPDGRELFDLPDAPRPDEDVAAPVRLLPDYDNVIAGYADRSRILSPEAYRGLWRANGLRPAFTVDGEIRGSWKFTVGKEKAAAAFAAFTPLSARERDDIEVEAAAMMRDLTPGLAAEISFAAVEG